MCAWCAHVYIYVCTYMYVHVFGINTVNVHVYRALMAISYLFKVFGHDNVSILDGGLPKWVEEGRATVSGEQPLIPPSIFKANHRPQLVRDFKQMMDNYQSKREQVYSYCHVPSGTYNN